MRASKIALASASLMFAFSSTAARAETCQPGSSGCVLPLPRPAAPVAPVADVPVAEPFAEAAEAGTDFLLPALLALAVLGLGAYFLFFDDDDKVSP